MMEFPFADAHCHLADRRFGDRIREVLLRARNAGIGLFLQGGVDEQDWSEQRKLIRVAQALGARVVPVFGVHPWFAGRVSDEQLENELAALRTYVREAVAIGETGLDYSAKAGDRERQLFAFEKQLELAKQLDKALVLHVVRAHHDVIKVLERYQWPGMRGLVHAFAGTSENAERYVDLGFMLSIGGAVTKSEKLRRVLRGIPNDRIVVESDAPDQAPAGFAGSLNEPTSIMIVAQTVADVRCRSDATDTCSTCTADDVLRLSSMNLRQFLAPSRRCIQEFS